MAEFVLAVLACYRVALLFAYDEGPFAIFHKLRVVTGVYEYGENGQPETIMGRFMNCPYCLGVWIAIPLAFVVSGLTFDALLVWLAIAGGQAFLQGLTK